MVATIFKILLLLAIFIGVIGSTYPKQRDAIQEEQASNYDNGLIRQALSTQKKYEETIKNEASSTDERLAAGNAYAAALSSQQRFEEAAKIYQDQLALTWGLVNNAYNQKWADASMHLAGAHRNLDNQPAALVCYDSVLKHDQQFLPANDPRIARDLNNMGLMHYLMGTGKTAAAERKIEFKTSRDYLEQSLAILDKNNQGTSAKAAATLWNLVLTCRDLDDKSASEQYKLRAQAIDKSFNRVCREP
ncbi:hypothetical protein KBF38_08310 [bacterium]|nr:hypothetical protein [bacterium]